MAKKTSRREQSTLPDGCLEIDRKIGDSFPYVDMKGVFYLDAGGGNRLSAASFQELEEEYRKFCGVRKREPLNIPVAIFIDEGWEDSAVHEGTLLGYRANSGAVRLRVGKKIEHIKNTFHFHIVLKKHPHLATIKKAWEQRNQLWRELEKVNLLLHELFESAGTDCHSSWSINIDRVQEQEAELKEWLEETLTRV